MPSLCSSSNTKVLYSITPFQITELPLQALTLYYGTTGPNDEMLCGHLIVRVVCAFKFNSCQIKMEVSTVQVFLVNKMFSAPLAYYLRINSCIVQRHIERVFHGKRPMTFRWNRKYFS